jgi:hypothetical protein
MREEAFRTTTCFLFCLNSFKPQKINTTSEVVAKSSTPIFQTRKLRTRDAKWWNWDLSPYRMAELDPLAPTRLLKSRKVVIPWIFLSGSETVLCGNE